MTHVVYGVSVCTSDLYLCQKHKVCGCDLSCQIVVPSSGVSSTVVCSKCSKPFWETRFEPVYKFNPTAMTYCGSNEVIPYLYDLGTLTRTELRPRSRLPCLIGRILGETEDRNHISRDILELMLDFRGTMFYRTLPGSEFPSLFLIDL